MPLSLSEHKLPVAVTTVGLLIASGLAMAPILMADSPADLLSAKNSTEIESINALLQNQSVDLDQRFASRSSQVSGQLNNLDAQVLVLNKAVKNIHNKALKQSNTTDAALDEITSGPRLINLEKAVANLHKNQNKSSATLLASIQKNNDNSDNRIKNLEKAVKRLHLRQQQNKDKPATTESDTTQPAAIDNSETELRLLSIEREYRDVFSRMAALESTVQQLMREINEVEQPAVAGSTTLASAEDNTRDKTAATTSTDGQPLVDRQADNRIENLELLVQQLQGIQPRTNRPDALMPNTAIGGSTATDMRVRRLERVIARMDRRMKSRGNSAGAEEDMIDRLYEMQDYIDQVLDQLDR